MWLASSLRGLIEAELEVSLIKEGVHSGHGSGVFADSFRVANMLLARLEDAATGKFIPHEFYGIIPQERIDQTKAATPILQGQYAESYPVLPGVQAMHDDFSELLLNRTWRPTLTITGANLPKCEDGGNVLRPCTKLKLSIRLPPNVDAAKAQAKLIQLMEQDTPYNAHVTCKITYAGMLCKLCSANKLGDGWDAPPTAPWVLESLNKASKTYFGLDIQFEGGGGSIPFMGMLGKAFPMAQFCITGVLVPKSNAHGPNGIISKNINCY